MKIQAIPIPLKHANRVVNQYHRHNKPVAGALFCIGAVFNDALQGVAIVGRPVARLLDDGYTAEVLRVCTLPNAQKGSCSFLYAKTWRAWRAMGGNRIVTYTLESETGASLRGAGWNQSVKMLASGNRWKNRNGRADQDVYNFAKYRWEKTSGAKLAKHPKEFRLFDTEQLVTLSLFEVSA